MRTALRWLGIAACTYVVCALGVGVFQRKLIYLPPPVERPEHGTVLSFTDHGLPVVALHFPAPADSPTLVYFHGNGDQLGSIAFLGALFRQHALGFYAVEYPGYGLAGGVSPTEQHIYAVAQAAIEHLERDLGVSRSRIVVAGHSLGSGVAAEMARRGLCAKLVLLSPYTSMKDMADRVLRILPNDLLLRDRFDTAGKAASLHLPVLIVHGALDEVIPVAMGRQLAATIAGAQFVIDPLAGHNDLVGGQICQDAIAAFAR